ncbi:MAG TPA: lysylphosphatidylglycerol synthase transmembrane domain-containing protein [Gemmatimonadales bacterium]|jgi:hypothetical protein
MDKSIAPRLLRRGLEVFAVVSAVGFAGILLYGNNLPYFIEATLNLHWSWLLLGLALASADWMGGGVRLFVLLRHLRSVVSLKGCVLSAGLNAWATMLTPSQAGGGPVGIYVLKRYGTPIPEGTIATFMSFVATILFFAVAGPVAIFLGAGRSLEEHGVLGALSLRDLFRLSLGGFVGVGVVILIIFVFPGLVRAFLRYLLAKLEGRASPGLLERVAGLSDGVDQLHAAMVAFLSPRGWLALGVAVVLTAVAYANKLLAGYIVLRTVGIEAPFVDVLLLQTLIVFLLYFAPTPGGSGLAEILSAAVMSIYVPRELTPSYILMWRIIGSYLTVGLGSILFWRWLKLAEERVMEVDAGAPNGP